MIISPQVHRAFYQFSIKKFLEKKGVSVRKTASELDVNISKDLGYSKLLDKLIERGNFTDAEVEGFLIDEFSYGRMKNVYINQISTQIITDEDYVIKCVKSLSEKNYLYADFVRRNKYVGDLGRAIPHDETHLVYFEIKKKVNKMQSIHMLFANNHVDSNGKDINNYYPVEIRLDHKFLVIRLRNWAGNEEEVEESVTLDQTHKQIRKDIVSAFGLRILSNGLKEQKVISAMLRDITDTVLSDSVKEVDDTLRANITSNITAWSNKLFKKDLIPPADREVLGQHILNSYYKLHLAINFGATTLDRLAKLGVEAYPRKVKFLDGTISEGRAKSNSPEESLLDTDIFYDIKARLDAAKQIKSCTVYWTNAPGYERLGTTFYTEVPRQFKFVCLINFFDKEISDYVLQQVKKYC